MEQRRVSGRDPPARAMPWRAAGAVAAAALAGPAGADVVDLTAAGRQGTINGAIFGAGGSGRQGGDHSAIVRIQGAGVQQGYNTSGRPLAFDEKSHNTRDLKLGEMGRVLVGGAEYYEFALSVDENDGAAAGPLSLDAVQIYVSGQGGQTTATPAELGTLVYDMDLGGDNWVRVGTDLGPGGAADMHMLIPAAAFAGIAADSFVYLYSMFGVNQAAEAGFEQWSVRTTMVPLPPAVWLGGVGLGLAAASRFAQRRRHVM